VAATTIVQTGKGVMTTLARHPLVMFSLGIAAGYLAHKYRKEIISITSKTAEQSKDFVLRQKEISRTCLRKPRKALKKRTLRNKPCSCLFKLSNGRPSVYSKSVSIRCFMKIKCPYLVIKPEKGN